MKKRQPGWKWANRISVFARTEATASKKPSPCIPARSFRIRIRIQGVFLGLGRNSLADVIAISRQPFPNRPCPSTPCVQPGLFPAQLSAGVAEKVFSPNPGGNQGKDEVRGKPIRPVKQNHCFTVLRQKGCPSGSKRVVEVSKYCTSARVAPHFKA